MITRRKEPVDEGLGIPIGKLGGRNVAHQHILHPTQLLEELLPFLTLRIVQNNCHRA